VKKMYVICYGSYYTEKKLMILNMDAIITIMTVQHCKGVT